MIIIRDIDEVSKLLKRLLEKTCIIHTFPHDIKVSFNVGEEDGEEVTEVESISLDFYCNYPPTTQECLDFIVEELNAKTGMNYIVKSIKSLPLSYHGDAKTAHFINIIFHHVNGSEDEGENEGENEGDGEGEE